MDKRTFYGSGKVYSVKYDKDTFPTSSAAALAFAKANMIAANQVGFLKGGFKIEVTTNNLSDKPDLGEMKVDVITEETCNVTFGLFNANAEVIGAQYPTAQYQKGGEGDDVTGFLEVGGLDHISEDLHVIIFHHLDTEHGDTVAITVCKNVSGFENAWTPDSVTPFTCNYAAQPYDDAGHFYQLLETKPGYKWTA